MALVGQASGPVGPLDLQILNAKGSLFVTRPSLNHHIATREELLQRAIKSNVDLAETLAGIVKQINTGLGKIAVQAQKLKTMTAEGSQERGVVNALMNEAGSLARVRGRQ